jgi:hypothetical protein
MTSTLRRIEELERRVRTREAAWPLWFRLIHNEEKAFDWATEADRLVANGEVAPADRERVRFIIRGMIEPKRKAA